MQAQAQAPFKYDQEWLDKQPLECGERALLAVFAHFGLPKNMLDLGCGQGHLCKLAAKLGVLSVGLDIALNGNQEQGDLCKLGWCDLTQPLEVRRGFIDLQVPDGQFECVVSWETGEHLPLAGADTYVDNIVRHVGKGLVFTAAEPGQGGDGHINCQTHEWWREKFEARGLMYLADATEQLRETWRWSTGSCSWYPRNCQVFTRKGD